MEKERGPFFSNRFVARAALWGLLAWALIGLLIVVGVFYRFVLHPVRIIFPPLLLALVFIYLLNPIITRLQARGLPRVWATLIVYVVFLGIVGLSLAYVISAVSHQVSEFVKGVPVLLERAQQGISSALDRLGVHLDTNALIRALEPGNGSASKFVGRLTSFASGVFQVAFALVLGPLIAFYLLVDMPKIRRSAEALVPAPRRDEARQLAHQIGDTLGGFFRGQLVVALAVGLFSMAGFFVTGLPFFALLGAITGLFALVPLIGPILAAVPVLFVALTTSGRTGGLLHISGGWRLALAGAIVLVLAQQIDTRLLSPLLQRRQARLNPVTVLLSLLVGGALLGLWGMLLAVPTVAVLKVVVLYLWDTRSAWPPGPAEHVQPRKAAGEVPAGRPPDRTEGAGGKGNGEAGRPLGSTEPSGELPDGHRERQPANPTP